MPVLTTQLQRAKPMDRCWVTRGGAVTSKTGTPRGVSGVSLLLGVNHAIYQLEVKKKHIQAGLLLAVAAGECGKGLTQSTCASRSWGHQKPPRLSSAMISWSFLQQWLQISGRNWVQAKTMGDKNWKRQSGSSLLSLWTWFLFCLFTPAHGRCFCSSSMCGAGVKNVWCIPYSSWQAFLYGLMQRESQ